MESNTESGSRYKIQIPLVNEPGNLCVSIFPDELPLDHNDLIDVLRSELAPLATWRMSAVSCHLIVKDIFLTMYLVDIAVSII